MFPYSQVIPEFYHEGILDFVKGFSVSNEIIICFFFSFHFYMVDYTDRFLYDELSLHLWVEAYLIIVDDFSDTFFDLFWQYFIEYFLHQFSSVRLVCNSLFSNVFL